MESLADSTPSPLLRVSNVERSSRRGAAASFSVCLDVDGVALTVHGLRLLDDGDSPTIGWPCSPRGAPIVEPAHTDPLALERLQDAILDRLLDALESGEFSLAPRSTFVEAAR